MGKAIAIANQKGGVGKTTTAVNLAAGLDRLGYRVVAVDCDPQGHLSLSLGLRPRAGDTTLYELLVAEGFLPSDAAVLCGVGSLRVVPATADLAAAEVQLAGRADRQHALRPIVETLAADADFVLLDCPPSLSLLTINALACADSLIAPLECSFLATQGFRELMDTYERVREHLNPGLRICGILLTMYDGRTLHSREVAERVREMFGDAVFDTVIPHSVRFREAPMTGQSLLDYAPDHPGAAAYMQLAREVIEREG